MKLYEKIMDIELSEIKLAKINEEIAAIEEQYYKERIACSNKQLSVKGVRHFEKTEHKLAKLEKKASRERQKQFQFKNGKSR